MRGDTDSSGTLELTDGVRILGFLFFLGDPSDLSCADAADADDDGVVQIADANDQEGRFEPGPKRAVGPRPTAVAVADFEGDGTLDVVVSSQSDSTLSVLLNDGNRGFLETQTLHLDLSPTNVVAGDIDANGSPDLVVTQGYTPRESLTFFRSRGNGTFLSPSKRNVGAFPMHASLGDLDGDSYVDLAVACYGPGGKAATFRGLGDGTFEDQVDHSMGNWAVRVLSADFDEDGDLDLAAALVNDVEKETSGQIAVLYNNGHGLLEGLRGFKTGFRLEDFKTGDLDHDGNLDLAVTIGTFDFMPSSGGHDQLAVCRGDGRGGFRAAEYYSIGNRPRGFALADFDRDGNLDAAAVTVGSGRVYVLRNLGPP